MSAKVGDLAWAGPNRVIWIVLGEHMGMVIRNSDNVRWPRDQRRTPGDIVNTISPSGLNRIGPEVELTDEELALAAKGVMLHG